MKEFYFNSNNSLFNFIKIGYVPKQFSLKIHNGTGFFYKDNDNQHWLITSRHILYPPDNPFTHKWKYSDTIIKRCYLWIYNSNKDKDEDKLLDTYFLDTWIPLKERTKEYYDISADIDIILISVNELFIRRAKNENEYLIKQFKAFCNYFILTEKNISYQESFCNEKVCLIGFPEGNRGKYPSLLEGNITCDNEEINKSPLLKIDKNILRGFSGSPCFLSKSIEKFNQTGNLQDLKLVGIAAGILPNENESKLGDDERIKIKNNGGIIFKNKFIEKILKNKFT